MNNIVNFISAYWIEIVSCILIVIGTITGIVKFLSQPKAKQIEQIKAWLLGAVTLAEAEFGSGTGKIKLSVVYDAFVEKFPWIAKFLSFTIFGKYVDEALVEMRKLLSTNEAVAAIVESPDSIKTEINTEEG
ncbi:MAG: hypothetical protein Q4C12_00195 [Clostridia bacterium]|nr:hypothetical protein [Clostridia bacterium]